MKPHSFNQHNNNKRRADVAIAGERLSWLANDEPSPCPVARLRGLADLLCTWILPMEPQSAP